MFNLKTVVKFEVLRALKKPTFWIAALSIPAIYLAFFALGQFSGKFIQEAQEKLAKEEFSFEILDKSGILNSQLVESVGGKISAEKQTSIEKVKSKKIDAFYYVPDNIGEKEVEIFSNYTNFTDNQKYSAVISNLLKTASIESVDKNKIAALSERIKTNETIFKDGEKYSPIGEMVMPGIFLVIFYLIIGFLSNRMLTSTTEEKENRVTEMILTSISAKTLILGKIISIVILGFVQMLTLFLPAIIAYSVIMLTGNSLNLPEISKVASDIGLKFDATRIAISAVILIAGFLMTTGFIVSLGSAMPTAQEASNYFGVIVMLLMAPFFVFPLFTLGKPNTIVQLLSVFPLTSPIALLLRNTLGTLPTHEAIFGIIGLIVFAIIAIWLAVRIFQYGTIAYGSKINIKGLFSKKKTA